jgi:hypothetical protein
MAWVRFLAGARDFSLVCSVQTGSGAKPASYIMGTGGGLFPRGKSGEVVKLTTHLNLVTISRMVELNLHSDIRLHGVVLNQAQGQIELTFMFKAMRIPGNTHF